jgi:hypothetical protein
VFAGAPLLAGRAVRHVIVELEIAVELGNHVDGAQSELVDGRAAAERRRAALVRRAGATDDLGGGASDMAAPLLEASLALPAVENEAAVLAEGAETEVAEAEAGRLLVGTLVVGVARAGERRSQVELLQQAVLVTPSPVFEAEAVGETYRRRHAGGESQNGNEVLHLSVAAFESMGDARTMDWVSCLEYNDGTGAFQ